MVTGWLTWTCLLLAAPGGGPADDVVYWNQRDFQIPIRVAPERKADIKELILFVSKDEGRTWNVHSKAMRDQKAFDVHAPVDGPMWFSIAVVDRNDKRDPPDPYSARPGQKMYIDTVKPEVHIASADRVGNEIDVHWEVREAYPDWTTLRLDYRVGDAPGGQPVPVPIEPGEHGNYKLRVTVPGPVTLRLQLRDLAGNEAFEEKVVSAEHGVIDRGVIGASAVDSSALRTVSPGSQSGFEHVAGSSPPAPPPAPVNATPGPVIGTGNPGMGMAVNSFPSGPASASQSGSSSPIAGGTAGRGGALPPLRIVNKKQVKLDFEVTEYGPSGVGSVDVYVTTDEGASWDLTKPEPGASLPAVSEAHGPGPLNGSVSLLLPKEGAIYGFYLVVKSRVGLGQPAPKSGDMPQLRVELDTTAPTASMYAPVPDPGQNNSLVLAWWAEDRNLATNPVTLEWAIQREGPWEFIGEPQLPNTGKYSWRVPPKIPPKVFLRLTVRDTAGNTAIAQTPDPVPIDLSVPTLNAKTMRINVSGR